jgi:hypothetical protein
MPLGRECKSRHGDVSAPCPLYPKKRTSAQAISSVVCLFTRSLFLPIGKKRNAIPVIIEISGKPLF